MTTSPAMTGSAPRPAEDPPSATSSTATAVPDQVVGTTPTPDGTPPPELDVVVPVYNEEDGLEPCIERLHTHLAATMPYRFRITIADNASTDGTLRIARQLAERYPEVAAVHLDRKGRGLALREVWSASDATVLAYLDVDLSTDLAALHPLVASLLSGHSELAIGTRLARGSRVVRGPKREVISRCYNVILRGSLAARFSDAQCGFKAIRGDVAARLLPLVEDTGWFFDTEMLVLAERAGLRIHEVPVDWVDDPDSRVDLVTTAVADLRGVLRVGRALATGRLPLAELGALACEGRDRAAGRSGSTSGISWTPGIGYGLRGTPRPATVAGPDPDGVPGGMTGQLIRFAMVGLVSTLAYVVLYAVLRYGMGPQPANLLALLATTIGNTAANRRLTFGVRGPGRWWVHQLPGLAAFAVALVITGGSLAALAAASPGAGPGTEIVVALAAGLVVSLLRFVLLRSWVVGRL